MNGLLCPVATIPSFTTMKVNVSRLESKIKELKRNKQLVKLNDIMNEAFIHSRRGKDTFLFTNIKTASWLNSETQTEIKQLLQRARSAAPEFKRLYQERRMQMLQERSQLLQAKQRALQATQEKKMREKERLTQEILQYGQW